MHLNQQVTQKPVTECCGRPILQIDSDRKVEVSLALTDLFIDLKVTDPRFWMRGLLVALVVHIAHTVDTGLLFCSERCQVVIRWTVFSLQVDARSVLK